MDKKINFINNKKISNFILSLLIIVIISVFSMFLLLPSSEVAANNDKKEEANSLKLPVGKTVSLSSDGKSPESTFFSNKGFKYLGKEGYFVGLLPTRNDKNIETDELVNIIGQRIFGLPKFTKDNPFSKYFSLRSSIPNNSYTFKLENDKLIVGLTLTEELTKGKEGIEPDKGYNISFTNDLSQISFEEISVPNAEKTKLDKENPDFKCIYSLLKEQKLINGLKESFLSSEYLTINKTNDKIDGGFKINIKSVDNTKDPNNSFVKETEPISCKYKTEDNQSSKKAEKKGSLWNNWIFWSLLSAAVLVSGFIAYRMFQAKQNN